MYEHSCAKAGAAGCGWTTTAATEEELRQKLTEHVKKAHNVKNLTDTIYSFLRQRAAR